MSDLSSRLSALADDISHQKDVSLGVLVDTLREAETALADALGLLQEVISGRVVNGLKMMWAEPGWYDRRDALLAKHGKTEEAKTNG